MTLDHVPEEFYPEIAENVSQREEWVRLFAIDKIRKDLAGAVDYSEPLTVEFLKANPYLVLDTRHFSEEFKWRLISALEDIDEQCDGLLVHSENFQALNLMLERYREQIHCIYIDPPYNTGSDEFIYKDNYQHSSWLAMMEKRMSLAKEYLEQRNGAAWINLDDNEVHRMVQLMNNIQGEGAFIGNIAWKKTTGDNKPIFAFTHDNIIIYGKDAHCTPRRAELSKEQRKHYANPDNDPRGDWAPGDYRSKWTKTERPNLYYPIIHPKTGEKIYPDTYSDSPRVWGCSPETHEKNVQQNLVWWGTNGMSKEPKKKRFLKDHVGVNIRSVWTGAGTNEDASQLLRDLFDVDKIYSTPKPVGLIEKIMRYAMRSGESIFDFFAGSGTTAHAVINLNREDNGKRKYILVEMGDYFDTVLMPRIKKVVYSKDWKNGRPISRDTGISHMFKYIRLESYEDALANIELKRTGPQQLLLDKSASFRESYMLKYMLETEAKGSPSLLNIDWFDDPFNYKLLVGTGSVGETKAVAVDLVETFNWLLGLRVRQMDSIRLPAPQSEATRQAGGFRIVEGTNPKGEKVLIIWRKIRDFSETDRDKIRAQREQANRDLEEFFRKQQYNTLDSEFDVIYVNGDNNLMNIPLSPEKEGLEPRYKVRLIEEEFKRLMFDVKDV
jgi:adenine-specific DNA-methyltransferase